MAEAACGDRDRTAGLRTQTNPDLRPRLPWAPPPLAQLPLADVQGRLGLLTGLQAEPDLIKPTDGSPGLRADTVGRSLAGL